MVPFDIQVSRSKVKVKGLVRLLHLVQLIIQDPSASEALYLESRLSLISKFIIPIIIQGQ